MAASTVARNDRIFMMDSFRSGFVDVADGPCFVHGGLSPIYARRDLGCAQIGPLERSDAADWFSR